MRRAIPAVVLFFLISSSVYAIKVSLFVSTDRFVERSKDIIVATCKAVHEQKFEMDGLYPVDVEITKVLKGDNKAGKAKIATIYPMDVGKTYLLSSLGGSAFGTDILAIPELSVVEIPPTFDFKALQGKAIRDQMQAIFDARLAVVKWKLQTLETEKRLLNTAAMR